MFRHPLVAAVAPLLLTSCFSYGAVHSYRTERGRPLAEPGMADAYLVWHDGEAWHLRARSEVPHTFAGRIEGARPESVSPVRVDPAALQTRGDAVAFAFVVDPRGGEAGFDWKGGCAELSLYVEGDDRPLRIFAGAFGASPPRVPFSLCP